MIKLICQLYLSALFILGISFIVYCLIMVPPARFVILIFLFTFSLVFSIFVGLGPEYD